MKTLEEGTKKPFYPMNLQLFAENPEAGEKTTDDADTKSTDSQTEASIEQLMTELAKERAERAKLKNSLDEASSEAAKYKKQLREKQTAKEIEDEEKQKEAEAHKAYVAELESFKRKAEAKSRYALQGMGEELATQAAEAEVKGDMDELANIQRKHTENLLKEKEKEWIKNRPDINAGNSEDDELTQLEKQIEAAMFGNSGVVSYQ